MASHGLKTLFYIFEDFLKRLLKGIFFALLRTSLPTAKVFRAFENIASNCKKGTFSCLSWDRLKPKKRYLFCALKHRLVKWEMDEERTILTSKYHSLESWKYLTSFSNKRYLFLTFIVKDKHREKRWQFFILFNGKWMHKLSFSSVLN